MSCMLWALAAARSAFARRRQAGGSAGKGALGPGRTAKAVPRPRAGAQEALARRFARIDATPQHLGRPWRRGRDAGRSAQQRGQLAQEVVHARRDAGPDVVDAGPPPAERGDDRLDDIADVDVITLVPAVAVHGDRLPPLPRVDEDRDDAALEIAALPRPVEVREAQRDGGQARSSDDPLGLRLETPVVGLRIDGRRLVSAYRRLAVDRAPGGDVHEDRRVRLARQLDDVLGPPHDDVAVELLLLHRLHDLCLRRAVHDAADALARERALERGAVGDVGDAELGPPVEVGAIARGKIVDHEDLIAAREERVDDVAPEESGAAGDQHTQGEADCTDASRPTVHRRRNWWTRGGRIWWRSLWTTGARRGGILLAPDVAGELPLRAPREVLRCACLPV